MNWQWLRHAFAIEPAGPAVPTEPQREVLEKLCAEIARRRMTTAAILFLETVRPLNLVAAQGLRFFSPFLTLAAGSNAPVHLAAFLERRGSVDYLCQRLEEQDARGCAD